MAKSGLGEGPTKDCTSSLVLLRSPDYAGLSTHSSSPFHQFPLHPLYLFPILGEVAEPRLLEPSDFSLQTAFQRLQQDSPFRGGDLLPFTDALYAPENSICSPSQALDSLSQYADPLALSQEVFRSSYSPSVSQTDFSLTAREALDNIQRAFAAVQQDQLRFLTGSSFEDSQPAQPSLSFRASEDSVYRRFRPSDMSDDMSVLEEGQPYRLPVFTTTTRAGLATIREQSANVHLSLPKPYYVPAKVLAASVTQTSFMTVLEQSTSPYRDAISAVVCKLAVFGRRSKEEYELQAALPLCGCYISPRVEFASEYLASKARAPRNISELPAISPFLLSSKVQKHLLSTNITWVSCGFEHVAALNASGDVLTWGYGASGVLGHGDTKTVFLPRQLRLKDIVCIESGAYHTVALGREGEVWTWGRGDMWQLGHERSEMTRDDMGYVVLRPKQVNYFKDKTVKGVACGEAHTLALGAGGEVYSFGWGAYGQLGRGPWDTHLPAAEQIAKIPTLTNVWKVSCGLLYSCCLTDTGQVWTWGSGEAGQLGRGATFTQSSTPQQIETLTNVIDVICGESHVLAVNKLGEMYAWGLGMAGELEGFEPGMEVVCFLPQRIGGVEAAWAVAGPQHTQEFASSLLAKLQQLQDRNIDSV